MSDPTQVAVVAGSDLYSLVRDIMAAVGPVGAFALVAFWIWNKKQAGKRADESEAQPEVRRAASVLEQVLINNKHILDVRAEAEDIAETVRALAVTTDRQEAAIGKVHDLCLESRTILDQVNRRLDDLERRRG